MDYKIFGRTGLQVSVAGLGSGGASRLGLDTGSDDDQAIRVVRRALEIGVNYFDTATSYGTEHLIGQGLKGRRYEAVISTKIAPRQRDGSLLERADLRRAVDASLKNLLTDVVDVYHLHRPDRDDYDYCVCELVPELLSLRDKGKLRFIGISEWSRSEVSHSLLHRALDDDCWDVVMVAFSLLNQSARETILSNAIAKNVATEIMGAAREPLNRPEELVADLLRLVREGRLDAMAIDRDGLLGFLSEQQGTASLADTCYRFAAQEPGTHVVLLGTGNVSHLEENVRSLNAGPLPEPVRDRLVSLFGQLNLVPKQYRPPEDRVGESSAPGA